MNKRPTISCCMMVRDCQETLPKAIASVRAWADELCIIDTGSTDETQAIARAAADCYEERPWPGDFSEARNWTLAMASSDYLFVLDSDEYIERPETMGPLLKRALRKRPAALDVQVINTIGGGEVMDFFWQVRCFRNDARIRYRSVVHHQCQDAIRAYIDQEGGRWDRLPGFTIMHTGYDLTGEERRAKYRPRVPLYAEAVQAAAPGRDREYYRYQHGVGMYQAGYPEAAVNILSAVDTQHLDKAQCMHLFSVLCKAYLQMVVDGKDVNARAAGAAASVLVARYANSETLTTAGHLALAVGQHIEALVLYLRAVLYPAKGQDRRVARAALIKNITILMEQKGSVQEAAALRSGTPEQQEQMARFMLDVLGVAA